jgi:hypothetical protein
MKWSGQLLKGKKSKLGNPAQTLSPPKKCLVLNKFLLNVQGCSMRLLKVKAMPIEIFVIKY